jgi:phosphopantothenoylcysteine decarboxylase / phosphopantothenate---cysteine ligase
VNIVLGVSGGIAAYKAPELVRRLQDTGAAVRVILTPNAARFVSPLSLAAVSGRGVIVDQWGDHASGGVDHIALARWADLLLVAPATANLLAKIAVGIADDALTTYAIAHRTRIAVAPAMNSFMYAHPTVRENLSVLLRRGVEIIEPDSGWLACGDEGPGRLASVPAIVDRVRNLFAVADLEGRKVLVTAGPTREAIDAVRYISNRSSGRMGYALAEAARQRGAAVTLITGPTALAAPRAVEIVRVTTAAEMHDAVMERIAGHDIVLKAAAVADFAPFHTAEGKIKKGSAEEMQIALRRTPDIAEAIGRLEQRPFLVTFAAETGDLEAYAREKMQRKRADMVVANDVSRPDVGFDTEENEVLLLSADGQTRRLDRAPKRVIANQILDAVVAALAV